jgi:hypothetical protein
MESPAHSPATGTYTIPLDDSFDHKIDALLRIRYSNLARSLRNYGLENIMWDWETAPARKEILQTYLQTVHLIRGSS